MTKNKISLFIYSLILLTIFCIGLNLFNASLYLSIILFCCTVLYLAINHNFLANVLKCNSFLLTLFFCLTMFFFSSITNIHSIYRNVFHYLLLPFTFYFCAIIDKERSNSNKQNISIPISLLFLGFYLQAYLHIGSTWSTYGFFSHQRLLIDFWLNSKFPATYLPLMMLPFSGICLYECTINYKEYLKSIPSALLLITSCCINALIANRGFFLALFLTLIIFSIVYIFKIKKNRKFKNIFYLICLTIILSYFFGFIFYKLNILNFKAFIDSIPLLNRIFNSGGGSNSARLNLYVAFFKEAWKFPFGGLYINKPENFTFAHNIWLDIYTIGGIIPSSIYTYLNLSSIHQQLKGIFIKKDNLDYCVLFQLLLFTIITLLEPAIFSSQYMFNSFFGLVALSSISDYPTFSRKVFNYFCPSIEHRNFKKISI